MPTLGVTVKHATIPPNPQAWTSQILSNVGYSKAGDPELKLLGNGVLTLHPLNTRQGAWSRTV